MIFGMMKDHDLRYIELDFYISIFDGLKVIRVQKYQRNPKKWIFLGIPFLVLEGSQNLYFWYNERT